MTIVLLVTLSIGAQPAWLRAGDDAAAGKAPSAARKAPPAAAPADLAIHRALEHLKGTQQPDGSWVSGTFGPATSITSLAVMSFLAAGHVPDEPGPYRQAIEKGIRYVLAHQHTNGMLVSQSSHGPMYCHGISTLMLADAAGMAADRELARSIHAGLVRAVKLILSAQERPKNRDHAGGWRYQPTSDDSDLSVTGWQVMALRAARAAGCEVPAASIDRAIDYVKRCAVKLGGGFSYQPGGGPNRSCTGTGILALEICGDHLTPQAVEGAEYLLKYPPKWSSAYFFYEVYYGSIGMFQMGDKSFLPYRDKLVPILLEHQQEDGSWLSDDGNDRTGGRNYCTSMAVLALTVEYRYLPIYQR